MVALVASADIVDKQSLTNPCSSSVGVTPSRERLHSVDGVEDACSNDFGAISKVEWEDAIAGGRRTDVRSDFEEVDRLITTFGSDPELVSVLGDNADTDEESGCILPPLLGSSDEGIGLIIDEVFFTELSVSFFTSFELLLLCTLFSLAFLKELLSFCFYGVWFE